MDNLLIGVAKVEITPSGSVPMAGYMARNGWSLGVHDPLWVRCFLFSQREVRFALVVLELLGVHAQWVREIQRRVADAANIPAGGVVVACTHTHSGPAGLEVPYGQDPVQVAVVETILTRVEECATQAAKNLSPAKIGVATVSVGGIAGHRSCPKRAVDQTLWALVIRDKKADRVRGVIANFPCHSTILGPQNRLLSGDLFGAAAASAERELGPNSVVAITVGAAGDISTRFFRQAQSFPEVARLGSILVNALVRLVQRSVPTNEAGIAIRWKQCWLPYKLAPNVNEVKRTIKESQAEVAILSRQSGTPPHMLRLVQTRLEGARQLRAMIESGTLSRGGTEILLCGLRLGYGILIGIPGEPFSIVGEAIRNRVTTPFQAAVLSLTNGYVGYFPDEDAVQAGWYEALVSPFDHQATAMLTTEVADLAVKMIGENDERCS